MGEDSGDWKRRLKALGISRRRGAAGAKAPDRRRVETGQAGEEIAARHLEERGLTILERNVRFRDGEIDLVAEEGPVLVFVEVRRRRARETGRAAESVTHRKRARVVRAGRRWLAGHPQQAARTVRFDVVAIDGEPPVVEWIRAAFDAV